jgi:hypothetical protein
VPKTWAIRISAYGLLSLKPVGGLAVALVGPEDGKVFKPRLAGGDFLFEVPSVTEGGYRLDVRLNGAPAAFIEENPNLPYRNYSRARRGQEAEELRGQKVLHVPLRPSGDSPTLEHPIVILP